MRYCEHEQRECQGIGDPKCCVGMCYREDYHEGPCNGWPRQTCFVYHDELGVAIPLGEHYKFQPLSITISYDNTLMNLYGNNQGHGGEVPVLQYHSEEVQLPKIFDDPAVKDMFAKREASLRAIAENLRKNETLRIIDTLLAPGTLYKTLEPKKKPWHLRLRQHLNNLRRKWKLHIYWGDYCGRCEPY